jgi:cyclophilin family peptidyl-prolyl cis-trans isomerase
VIGTVYTDSLLTLMENNKNTILKQQFFKTFIDKAENAGLKNTFISLQQRGNRDSLMLLSQEVEPMLDSAFAKMPHFMFSAAQRKAYTTIGGAPHLDGDYTVFGEVTSGLEVLDKLAMVPRDDHDRPLKDIRMKVAIKNKH